MAGKFNQVLEDYKRRAEAILDQKDKVTQKLNEALQKLLTKSPKAQAFFDDLKDFIQMIGYWVEGKYSELPYQTVLLVLGAILYFLNPLDLVPDVLPGLGFTDDAAVIALVVRSVSGDLEKFREWKRKLGLI